MTLMRHIAATLVALIGCIAGMAQPVQPVSWQAEAGHIEGKFYEIRLTGTINGAWHIYDLKDYGPAGPNGTVVSVEGEGFAAVGGPYMLSQVDKSYDDTFRMEIGTCSGPVIIGQKVELLKDAADVTVSVEWQACNDGTCIAPDDWSTIVAVSQACESVVESAGDSGSSAGDSGSSAGMTPPSHSGQAETPPSHSGQAERDPESNIWRLILAALAWGFVALLTPCFFPMIPMTVSFFLKQKGKWQAGVFGLSIVALYTVPIAIIILITYFAGGQTVTADIFNWLSTHWLPNLVFFAVFMLFAASFLGAFEITLPSSWLNKSDARSDKGGLAGIFFLALTLVLVSFSCTGPIVGSVLIKSTQGQFWEPIVTMLAFSVAFALPFTVLAFVPSLLKKLPKSGGWLASVKVVLGFIEIALGLKFLSVADQTYHWHLLDREIYLAIWIVVFALLGFYLLGKIRFKHDEPVEHIGIFRLLLVIVDFTFVVYMIPGMWGAPLKALSGDLPPITPQDFVLDPAQRTSASTYVLNQGDGASRKYADFLHLPYGIQAYFDYDEAREEALRTGKPILLDFTGHGCVNCREMEARVWSIPHSPPSSA